MVAVGAVVLVAAGMAVWATAQPTRLASRASDTLGTTSNTTTAATATVGSGYLAAGQDQVVFIEWNDAGDGRYTGTELNDELTGSPPNETVSANTESVSITHTGSQLSLDYGSEQVLGTYSGQSLVVNYPQQDGSLASVTFHKASTQDYNDALAVLRSTVSRTDDQSATATSIASADGAVDQAASAVAQDFSDLTSAIGGVQPALARVPKDLATAKAHLATTAADEQHARSEPPQQSQTCSDVDTVVSDADTVQSDADTIQGDADYLQGAFDSVDSPDGHLQSDWQALIGAEAGAPGYPATGAPDPSAVQGLLAKASNDEASAKATMNGYIDTANSYLGQAVQDASTALTSTQCGSAEPAPVPLSHMQ